MDRDRPLYRFRPDPDTFVLEEIDFAEGGPPFQWGRVSRVELFKRADQSRRGAEPEADFCLVCLILSEGEGEQRRAIQRCLARGSRNIKLNVQKPLGYLGVLAIREKERTLGKMDLKKMNKLLKAAFAPLRAELGLPVSDPVEYSFRIDDRVLTATADELCKQELERIAAVHKGILYPADVKKVRTALHRRFPSEEDTVIRALAATRSREHLCALSLSSSRDAGEIYISLANTHGDSLTLEGWKFVKLIENRDSPQLLSTLSELRFREPDSLFAFNQRKSGKVVARMDAAISSITVACLNEQNSAVDSWASFIVDIDYALCIYVSLKRLREDRERFARLKEEADTSFEAEIFDNLFPPL